MKSVKIKTKEKPEIHVFVYMEQKRAEELRPIIMGMAQANAGEWNGEGTDGKEFDVSFTFKSQIKANEFAERAKKLAIREVSLSLWDGNRHSTVPTLH
jgi:hypothetical protein